MSDAKFWRGEIDRSLQVASPLFAGWQENIDYYRGQSSDAKKAADASAEWVNVNADFYQVELKRHQLFFDTPDLQLKKKGKFFLSDPMNPAGRREATPEEVTSILLAHRTLLNELLGPDHADVLTTVKKALKDCLCPSGFGATKIGYEPTLLEVTPPEQLGSILRLNESTSVPVHESWYWMRIPPKKFRIPADFHDTDYDKAPWLGMDFRMPLALARRLFKLPPDFEAKAGPDTKVLEDGTQAKDQPSEIAYVDGTEIWYYAALVDEDAIHPQLLRRHVLLEGVDEFVEKTTESPFQTLLPNGRLRGDSMIGNPIHAWVLRDLPDSAYPPSDCAMTRPLVRELCRFRTQMVQARDANRSRILYDVGAFPPKVVEQIEDGSIGSMIGVEEGKLAAGIGAVMAEVVKGQPSRQDYVANDYVQKDLQQTLGIDAAGAGVTDDQNESATKTAVVDRNRNVRIDGERRQALAVYLKGVAKFSALVCRFMTPQLAVPYIGEQAAALWGAWDKQSTDGRIAFDAKPDSQIHLDAAEERKYWLQMYQFVAKDPNVVRVNVLNKLFEVAGENPQEFVVTELPEQKPDPNIGFTFKGEDLIGPQAPIVLEILAQGGIQVSQGSRDEAAGQLFKQMALGLRDASGKAVPATPRPQGHGGPADQVRPLSKQSADKSGERSGPKTQESAA